MPGPTGDARGRQVNVKQGDVGDDRAKCCSVGCAWEGRAAAGAVVADLANDGPTNSSQVGEAL